MGVSTVENYSVSTLKSEHSTIGVSFGLVKPSWTSGSSLASGIARSPRGLAAAALTHTASSAFSLHASTPQRPNRATACGAIEPPEISCAMLGDDEFYIV
jgi:hypothetical protein